MSHDRHSELGIHPLGEGEPQQRQQMMKRARLVLVVVLALDLSHHLEPHLRQISPISLA